MPAPRKLADRSFHIVIDLPQAAKLAFILPAHEPVRVRRKITQEQPDLMGEARFRPQAGQNTVSPAATAAPTIRTGGDLQRFLARKSVSHIS